ncbi:MAG: heme NO-binding domain-containing protein [Sulfitobacter sp.]
MHGLVNTAIQSFVSDSYGVDTWIAIAEQAKLGFVEFEAMWMYEDALTLRVLETAENILKRPRSEILEDIGTYLVSHPNVEPLRRLLRFGGVDFVEFLNSLDDLPDRARLAVSDLRLPRISVFEEGDCRLRLKCYDEFPGYGHVLVGILRAMADDYGVLAYLEHEGADDGVETVSILLLETKYAAGRSFELGAAAR